MPFLGRKLKWSKACIHCGDQDENSEKEFINPIIRKTMGCNCGGTKKRTTKPKTTRNGKLKTSKKGTTNVLTLRGRRMVRR